MRLIDADELIKLIDKREKRVIELIYELQTAYDIDKVVDELKILKHESLVEFNIGEYNLDNNIGNQIAETYRQDMNEGKCFAFDEAIEIVEQGCVASDDVCEWKYINDFELVSENHESKCIEGYDYKYCPYCGKKIKVGGKNDD